MFINKLVGGLWHLAQGCRWAADIGVRTQHLLDTTERQWMLCPPATTRDLFQKPQKFGSRQQLHIRLCFKLNIVSSAHVVWLFHMDIGEE